MNHNEDDRDNAVQVPLHRRIAENLSNQVSSGKLKPGEKLPSERQIARQFQASRATVRTALGHLEQAGLITRRERRSAVVAIRRDITPFMRIACSHPRLMTLFGKLSNMQILPPRCQLQLVDMQHVGSLRQLSAQPATGADILISDLETVNYFRNESDVLYQTIQKGIIFDGELPTVLENLCCEGNEFVAIPLGITTQVLYYNRSLLSKAQADVPAGAWGWDELVGLAQRLSYSGRYGFQFRPSLRHVSALMSSRGSRLYEANGRLGSGRRNFDSIVRFIHDLVHRHKVSPILAKADQINLFADGRCAMAMDGFDMYKSYLAKLGDSLGVAALAKDGPAHTVMCGFAAIVLANQMDIQPVQDLLRILLNTNNQKLMAQQGGLLPVRRELLNIETLESLDVPAEVGEVFLRELNHNPETVLPANLDTQQAVEKLFLELWLGLDNIESICRRFREPEQ
ncbi:MAG: extracellular solute-binding protein [Phycisphaerae bacterium]|nr:extracellular solute-binding protein [Phycisphaerae bacterium]